MKKESNKIKLSTIILSLIIVILLIVIALMFIFYSKELNKNESGIEAEIVLKDEAQNNSNEKTNTETLNTNSEYIKKLYSYIPIVDSNKIIANAYQDSKTTVNDFSDEYLLWSAFDKIELNEEDKLSTHVFDGPVDYSFKAEKMQDKVKEIYGKRIEDKSFEIGYGSGCVYDNGIYSHYSGGGSDEDMLNIRKIEKAYEDDEYIYIIDKYMALAYKGEGHNIELYKTSQINKLIGTVNENIYTKSNEEIVKDLSSQYDDKMTEYKHVFKKSENGKCYWYSTEPVK